MELVSARYALPITGDPIPEGGIIVEDGRILAVGTQRDLATQFPSAMHHHFETQVIIPGLVNPFIAIDMAQWTFPRPSTDELQDGTSPRTCWMKAMLERRRHTALDANAENIQYTINRLLHYGVTTVGAQTSYPGTIDLLHQRKMRGITYLELLGSSNPAETQDRFESALALVEKYQELQNGMRLGLAPLTPYLVSRNLLQIVSQHALAAKIPLQIHCAESFDEMELFFNASGPIGREVFPIMGWGPASGGAPIPAIRKTPIQFLEEITFLKAAPALIGCVQLSDADFPTIKRHACPIIYSPTAVDEFQLGTFPHAKIRRAEIPIALGTAPSFAGADGDLWEEMRAAVRTQQVSAREALAMATINAAGVLGLADQVGSLEPKKAADYVVIECPEDTNENIEAALIHATTPQQIVKVAQAGIGIADA